MKCFSLLGLAVFFLAACNNANTEKAVTSAEVSTMESNLQNAIQHFPDSLLLRENLIQYFSDIKNYPKAIQETEKVLSKDSNNIRFWHIKAQLYFFAEDTSNSIKAYEKCIDIFPDPGDLMDLGSLYAATKNPNALAIADALIIGKKADAEKEALFIKGLYYTFLGEKMKAIGFFDQCLQLDYTFMFAYREKAIALYDLAKYEEALEVLDKALTLQNGFDEGYYWEGRCLEKLNKQSSAIESYQSAIAAAQQNNDDNQEARDALARLGIKTP